MKVLPKRSCGLSLVELLVVLAMIALLFVVFAPRHHGGRVKAKRIACVSNLKQLGLALRIYASDHDERFPWMVSTNLLPERTPGSLEFAGSAKVFPHFQTISNELNIPRPLLCPMDTTRNRADEFTNLANTNISYFLGLDSAAGRPETILSGDRDMLGGSFPNRNLMLVRAKDVLKWGKTLHDSGGNIGMADGSAQQVNDARLNQQLRAGFARTNQLRFAIP